MEKVGPLISRALPAVRTSGARPVKHDVRAFCDGFPLYVWRLRTTTGPRGLTSRAAPAPEESGLVQSDRYPATVLFGRDGLLAASLPGYEERPVARPPCPGGRRCLRDGGLLLAEAGTGTGKTLAYLAPAVDLGRRVVVSTGTRNLQEQLLPRTSHPGPRPRPRPERGRDEGPGKLPLPPALAPSPARAASAASTRSRSSARSKGGRAARARAIAPRSKTSRTPSTSGARSPPRSENCIGQECPDYDPCWVPRMRQRALEADVVVVNITSSAPTRGEGGEVRGGHPALRHPHPRRGAPAQGRGHLALGFSISSLRIDDLVRDAERDCAPAASRPATCSARRPRFGCAPTLLLSLSTGPGRLAPRWMSPAEPEDAQALFSRMEGLRTAIMAISDRPDALRRLAARSSSCARTHLPARRRRPRARLHHRGPGPAVLLKATPVDVAARCANALRQAARGSAASATCAWTAASPT